MTGKHEVNQFCQPVQRYAATPCNGMLPLNATLCCHLVIIHAEGVQCCGCGLIRDDVRFELGRVRCGLPTNHP